VQGCRIGDSEFDHSSDTMTSSPAAQATWAATTARRRSPSAKSPTLVTVRAAAVATTSFPAQQRFPSLVHAPSEEDDAAVAEQPRTLLDEIGGPEVTRRAAQHAIIAVLAEADPELSVRPLFARLLADSAVDAHIGHLARSFQQLFGGGRSGHPLTEELLRSWHPTSAGRCTRRQLNAVSAHVMTGFTLACPNEEAVGRVGAYFGTYFDAIQRVFLTPDELRLTDA
jgi:hypothetical protein